MEILRDLLGRSTAQGRVHWIGVAPESRSAIQQRQSVQLVAGGIRGDHHCRPAGHSKRQVTLVQAEHLAAVAALLGKQAISPAILRRNLVVSGINLASLKYQNHGGITAIVESEGIVSVGDEVVAMGVHADEIKA